MCDITGHLSDMIYSLCYTDSLDNNAIGAGAITDRWVWVGWLICVSIIIFLLLQKDILQQRPQVTKRSTPRRLSKPRNVRGPQGLC